MLKPKKNKKISAKKAARKVKKGKGIISKPIPNTQKSPGVYMKTKAVKKGPMKGIGKKIVGSPKTIKSPSLKKKSYSATSPKKGTYGGTTSATKSVTKRGVTKTKTANTPMNPFVKGTITKTKTNSKGVKTVSRKKVTRAKSKRVESRLAKKAKKV